MVMWLNSIAIALPTKLFFPRNSSFPQTIPEWNSFCLTPVSRWILSPPSTGRGRHWNFDPLQCLRPRPEILDRYISLSCLRWLPTACHERLAYFHWPQWVTWLVTWWVTWSRWPDAGRHIGKFSLWTTLLRFSRSAQISLFSNFTKLGQLFFDNFLWFDILRILRRSKLPMEKMHQTQAIEARSWKASAFV